MDKLGLFFKCIRLGILLHRPSPPEMPMPDPSDYRVSAPSKVTTINIPSNLHVDSISLPCASQPMPTTSETVKQLRRRLLKELYRVELDLLDGARIAGKACDCLDQKHNFGLEATAEELMPMDNSPVYGKILRWLRAHQPEFTPENISTNPPEYYQSLVHEVRAFRKEIPES